MKIKSLNSVYDNVIYDGANRQLFTRRPRLGLSEVKCIFLAVFFYLKKLIILSINRMFLQFIRLGKHLLPNQMASDFQICLSKIS